MNASELLSAIDSEIATLQQARALLAGQDGHRAPRMPSGSKRHKRHKMSAEGRARIVAAQRKRWAKLKAKKKSA